MTFVRVRATAFPTCCRPPSSLPGFSREHPCRKAGFLKCKAGRAELLLSWSIVVSRQHGTERDMALPALRGRLCFQGAPAPTGPTTGPPSHPWLAAGSTVPSRPLGAFGSGQTPLGQVPSTGTKAESPSDGPGSWGRVQLPAQLLSSAGNQRGIEGNHPLAAFVTLVLPRAAVCLSGVHWWLSQAGCQGQDWGASISSWKSHFQLFLCRVNLLL